MAISVVALALTLAAVAAMLPTAALWVLTHGEELGEWLRAAGRRCHRPAPEVTYDPPIERIAADLRRLPRQQRQMRNGPSGAACRWPTTGS